LRRAQPLGARAALARFDFLGIPLDDLAEELFECLLLLRRSRLGHDLPALIELLHPFIAASLRLRRGALLRDRFAPVQLAQPDHVALADDSTHLHAVAMDDDAVAGPGRSSDAVSEVVAGLGRRNRMFSHAREHARGVRHATPPAGGVATCACCTTCPTCDAAWDPGAGWHGFFEL